MLKNIDFAFPMTKWHIIVLRFLLNGSAEGKLYQWERLSTIYLIAQFLDGKIAIGMN